MKKGKYVSVSYNDAWAKHLFSFDMGYFECLKDISNALQKVRRQQKARISQRGTLVKDIEKTLEREIK